MAILKKDLETEKVERERQQTLAAVKTEEIREIRGSLDKSLRTVEEDANNLRGMLGKSLHKIDRYTEAIRRGEAPTTTSDTEDSAAEINGEIRKSTRMSRRRTRSASNVKMRDRNSLASYSNVKIASDSHHAMTNGHSPAKDCNQRVMPQIRSPIRRYRKDRQSVA